MFRTGVQEDLGALLALERAASLAALGHVFPPERYPFPEADVLARWQLVLDDPEVTVLVADACDGGLLGYAAYDTSTLRHLAVRPDHWGHGLATELVETVTAAMDRRGCALASLWVLDENKRARRFYEYLGWKSTDDRREAPWPPYPTEVRYTRLVVQSDR
jgi:GNAT superfamily N-acetyltransferase